jgi:hypothetical protein
MSFHDIAAPPQKRRFEARFATVNPGCEPG